MVVVDLRNFRSGPSDESEFATGLFVHERLATFGRELLERAPGGRPSIDPKARPGQHSPVRQVRLPAEVNDQLAALAHAEHRSPSDVIRAALADYIAAHTAI